jgi:hypothetical protein
MTETTPAYPATEHEFRPARFLLVVDAIHDLQDANVFYDDDGAYPGWGQIEAALSALREFIQLPEYEEFSGRGKETDTPPF